MTEQQETGHTVTIVGPDGQPMGQLAVPEADGSEEKNPADTGELRLVSRHGSLTAAEMLVPLLVTKG